MLPTNQRKINDATRFIAALMMTWHSCQRMGGMIAAWKLQTVFNLASLLQNTAEPTAAMLWAFTFTCDHLSASLGAAMRQHLLGEGLPCDLLELHNPNFHGKPWSSQEEGKG